MEKQIISTDQAPAAIGPYSQAVGYQSLVFLSGQIPLDAAGQFVEGDFEAQMRQVLSNLSAVLQAAGLSPQNVLKTTIFLTDFNDFAQANALYAELFDQNPPARSTVQVAALPRGAKVEIEAIAGR